MSSVSHGMRSWIGLAAGLAALALHAPRAEACWYGHEVETKVEGVAKDGWFFTTTTSYSEHDDSETYRITLHDATGAEVETLELEEGQEAWTHTRAKGSRRAPRLAGLPVGRAPLASASDIVAKGLETTPLRRSSAKFRHAKTAIRCGSLERETSSGYVRIAEVGEQDFIKQFCRPIAIAGFTHPHSRLEFVRTSWSWQQSIPSGFVEEVAEDTFRWYPQSRIEGLELAVRGERALNAGKAAEALPMLERAIRLAPEYVPARRAVVWAAAQTKTPWSRLKSTLDFPIPTGTECVAWAERDAWMDFPRTRLPWAEADMLASVDVTWPWDTCREHQAHFYRDTDGRGLYH